MILKRYKNKKKIILKFMETFQLCFQIRSKSQINLASRSMFYIIKKLFTHYLLI